MADTQAGGKYKVGDQFVDANGKALSSQDEQAESKFAGMKLEELKAEAEKQGLEVKRGDGEEGAPLKADYVKALDAQG